MFSVGCRIVSLLAVPSPLVAQRRAFDRPGLSILLAGAILFGCPMAAIATSSEKSRKVLAYLRDELGLPDGLTQLHVHFDIDDVIRVDCSFMPQGEPGAVGSRSFQAANSGQVVDTTSV